MRPRRLRAAPGTGSVCASVAELTPGPDVSVAGGVVVEATIPFGCAIQDPSPEGVGGDREGSTPLLPVARDALPIVVLLDARCRAGGGPAVGFLLLFRALATHRRPLTAVAKGVR